MDNRKWQDVHQASISVAVRDDAGKLLMECIIETKAATIRVYGGCCERVRLWG